MTTDQVLVSVWTDLWNDFEKRAVELSDRREPGGSVDRVISWMRDGSEYTWKPGRPAAQFHLPELYSGAPWRTPGRKWAALLTINPAVYPTDIFPTVGAMRQLGGEKLASYFDDRFEGAATNGPYPNGRSPKGVCWAYRTATAADRAVGTWSDPATGMQHRYVGEANRTWSRLDAILKRATPGHGGLGGTASIMDVVPLKFRDWGKVVGQPHIDVQELVNYGWERLRRVLETLVASGVGPSCVAWMGSGTLTNETAELLGDPVPTGKLRLGGKDIPFGAWYGPTSFDFNDQAADFERWLSDQLR